jgi:EAL domain-containing protein (putative c-di-GMP-specific phosphodiesterase class I)/FixJ family two-component response regulator
MMKFLVVDDEPKDREAIKFWLAREFAGATFIETTSQEELAAALLSGGFDAAIIRCPLTWAPWKDVLEALKSKCPDMPVVMITDGGDDEIAVEAMKAGLSDYVLKRHLFRFLGKAVRGALEGVSLSRGRQYLFQSAGATTAIIDSELRFPSEQDLRRALETNETVVYYQPRFSLMTGAASGVEALVRWQHPRRGLLLPGEFIGLAEETGLIVPLGERVLREACHQARLWHAAGYPGLVVAVNLSVRQFQQKNLPEAVKAILAETGLEPWCLELEITENTVVQELELTKVILHRLRDMGVRIAIDDFGVGYCSLNYLRHFPVHTLKIDSSFVRGVGKTREEAAIVATIIDLAKHLDCTVVAEGVETAQQLAWLKEHGCDEVQGFFLCPPLPPDRIVEELQRSDRTATIRCIEPQDSS